MQLTCDVTSLTRSYETSVAVDDIVRRLLLVVEERLRVQDLSGLDVKIFFLDPVVAQNVAVRELRHLRAHHFERPN